MAGNNVEYVITLKDFFTAPLNNMVKEVDNADKKVQSLSSSILSMGAGFIAFMGLRNVASDVLDVGAAYELLQLRFNNMTGSAAEGQRIFERIKQDAETTPFSVESLGDATALFMSAGVSADDARNRIMDLGNAIAFAGKTGVEFDRVANNLNQIKGKGEASAQDMKEFGNAGIMMWTALGQSTGKSRGELEKLPITYDMLTEALHQANTENGAFANGLATVAGSTAIAMSNVSDGLSNFYNDVFQMFKPAIDSVIYGLQDIISFGRGVVSFMREWAPELNAVGAGLLVVASAYTLMSVGAAIASIQIAGVTVGLIAQSLATFGLAETWAMLNLTMSLNPIGAVIGALAVMTTGVMYAWNKFEGFRGFIMGMWGVMKLYGEMMMETGKAALSFLMMDFTGAAEHTKKVFELGKGFGEAFSKGQAEGIASFKEDNPVVEKDKDGKPKQKVNSKSGSTFVPKAKASSVRGNEVKNISITIGSLVDQLTVKVNEAKEMAPRIKEEITKVLLTAVNDVNVIGN